MCLCNHHITFLSVGFGPWGAPLRHVEGQLGWFMLLILAIPLLAFAFGTVAKYLVLGWQQAGNGLSRLDEPGVYGNGDETCR